MFTVSEHFETVFGDLLRDLTTVTGKKIPEYYNNQNNNRNSYWSIISTGLVDNKYRSIIGRLR